MTVADLSPMQLYGIVMAALATWYFLRFVLHAIEGMTVREKVFGYAALGVVFALPVIIGLLALRP